MNMPLYKYNSLASFPHFLFFFFTFLLPFVHPISFQKFRFDPDDTDIIYEGTAKPSVGAIQFNDIVYLCRVGRATYAKPMRLWDSTSGRLSDFTTHFTFYIDTLGNPLSGQGLAFFLAPVGFKIPPNSADGFLGLFNTTTRDAVSQNQIITVEFDSYANPEWDPPFQHVGINDNSLSSVVYAPWNASLHKDELANTWITYNATTKNLSVFWNYKDNPIFNGNSTLSYHVDLMKILPEWVTVGFSAATGLHLEWHSLYSWEFSSSLEIKERHGNNERKIRLVVGLIVPFSVLLGGLCITWVILVHRKRTRKIKESLNLISSMTGDFERGAGPRRFSYSELVFATNNFANERKLGEGGFGAVYKGFLMDLDLAVAVKKISKESKQGKKEYITEVKIISHLRHRNLVQLIGWCHDRGAFLLIYEYMPNGSLDSHLFGKKKPLTWAVRHKIALGLASALLYLHEEGEQCVVHRDIKSSNVMLDSSFNVKLGDFGLARLMDHELGPQTTGLAGTKGYLAPEYISTGKASKESDVFSFGVVILEIACGKRSVDPMKEESQMGLVEWAWEQYRRGRLLAAVDDRLCMEFDVKQMECLMVVGLWCAYPDHSFRPSIKQAIQALHFEAEMPNLSSKIPISLHHVHVPVSSSSEPLMTNSFLEVGR